jgi:serine/threonine protein kinase
MSRGEQATWVSGQTGPALGRYRVEALLGEGGMGQVFRARRDDGETVALKVLKGKWAGNPEYSRRFAREARAASEVDHKHLVGVVDFGEINGHQYLAMRYVAGRSLDERLKSDGQLPVDEVTRIAADVAAGLDALHRAHVVHRDVKASNVMLDEDGTALLTDFGLAKGEGYSILTLPGKVVGTLDYLAPELVRGEPATPSTDIYALGCLVFECLSGHPPFAGRPLLQAGMAILSEPPGDPCADRSDVPPPLSETVLRALAKSPEDRPPTATTYAHLLRAAAMMGQQ